LLRAHRSDRAQLTALSNALAESFFATIKKELIHRRAWPTKAECRRPSPAD